MSNASLGHETGGNGQDTYQQAANLQPAHSVPAQRRENNPRQRESGRE